MKCIPPDQPFRYLGPLFTLTMDWQPEFQLMLDTIATKGMAIASSPGTVEQKLEMERSCTIAALAYHFSIAPISLAKLRALDAARARVIKRILRLADSAPSEMLYLPRSRFGCGVVSLAPIYAQVCADTFAATLNDLGRLGTLARPVLRAQMKHKGATSLCDAPASWVSSNQHMQLRKASILRQFQLHVRYDRTWDPDLATMDLYELATMSTAAKALSVPLDQLQDHVIRPLWQAFGYTCTPFLLASNLRSLDMMLDMYPEQLASPSVKRAYSLLLQICCNPTCQFPQLLAAGTVAPAPCQYKITRTSQACPQLALPVGCPAHLPELIELSHITQFAIPQQATITVADGCHYQVVWCAGPPPSAHQLRLLQRLGIMPQPSTANPHPLHVAWHTSVLHWSILQAFWPAKLAAFEAKQLHHVLHHGLPAQPGMDTQCCYQQAQALAQHISAANIIPAYPRSADSITFQFTETNPDKDVCPTGNCLLARTSPDQVAIYDSAGAWVLTVSQHCIASLAAVASPDVFQLSTFATVVRGIMHKPLQDIRQHSPRDLFKQQFGLPHRLMASLQSMLQIRFEWFASAWNRHADIPSYASHHAGDHLFSSLGDAYSFKWLDSGFVNPGLTQGQAMAAVRWAIASCYEPLPVLNLLVVPKPIRTSALQAALMHPCVQHFITMPANCCSLPVPSFLHAHCLEDDRLPAPAVEVLMIANQLGIRKFGTMHSDASICILKHALVASGAVGFVLHSIHNVPSDLPDLPFKMSQRWRHAGNPPILPVSATQPDHCLRDRALAEILQQPPPLQWDAASIVYTDGSKHGTSITAAWVHPASGQSHAVHLPGPPSAQRTSLRGELAAIHEAIHSPQFPLYRPLTLGTDSLTSSQLISAHMVRPTQLRFHKHRWLIAAIAQNLLSRVAPVRIMKVRAHVGISGNEAADRLAAQAHEDPHGDAFTFTDPQDRQPAWVQYWFGDSLSDLDTLRHHALKQTEMAHVQTILDRPQHRQSKALQKVIAAEGRDNGLHEASSNAFWTARQVTDRQRSLALQIRFNMLPTRYRVALWYPSRNLPQSCPLCSAPKDTIGHRLGSCTRPAIKRQICARHGHAVAAIAAEIRAGMLGNCAMLVDAECHERYRAFPNVFLPQALQCSRPDIVLIENARCDFATLPVHYRRDPRIVVHLVEVGYASDFLLHERRQAKLQQHSQLCRNLSAFGWANVHPHCFIVGHTGVMLNGNAALLTGLGVTPSRVGPFLVDLAVASLRKSCAILSCFPSGLSVPDTAMPLANPATPSDSASARPPALALPSSPPNLPSLPLNPQLHSQLPPLLPQPPNLRLHPQLNSSLPPSLIQPLNVQFDPQPHSRLAPSLAHAQPLSTSPHPHLHAQLSSQSHPPPLMPLPHHPPPPLSPSHMPPRKRRRIMHSVTPPPASTNDPQCLQATHHAADGAFIPGRANRHSRRAHAMPSSATDSSTLPSGHPARSIFDPGG